MKEEEYCVFGEGYCEWCRHCIIKDKKGVDNNEH